MARIGQFLGLAAVLVAVSPASAQQQDALPPNFQGRITYEGTHQGELTRRGRTQQLGGTLTLELTFSGSSVKARYSGSGGINSGTMTGTRNGARCRLVDDRGGDVLEAECTRTRFSGISRMQNAQQSATVRFDARATQVVDTMAPPPRAAAPEPSRTAGGPTSVFGGLFTVSGGVVESSESPGGDPNSWRLRVTDRPGEFLSMMCSITFSNQGPTSGLDALRLDLFGSSGSVPGGMMGKLLNPQGFRGRLTNYADTSQPGWVRRRAVFEFASRVDTGSPVRIQEIGGTTRSGVDYVYVKTCGLTFTRQDMTPIQVFESIMIR